MTIQEQGLGRLLQRALVGVFALLALAAPLRAQETPPPTPAAPVVEQPDTEKTATGVTPRSAFISSLIVPGLGQWRVGAEKRAIAFTVFQGASWYMLLKTMSRLGDVNDRNDARHDFITDSLNTLALTDTAVKRQLTDPEFLPGVIDNDSSVKHFTGLIEARKEQRQDWIAYTLAITLASAVDAFVAAHLADFPAAIVTRPRGNGGVQFQVNIPVQRRR